MANMKIISRIIGSTVFVVFLSTAINGLNDEQTTRTLNNCSEITNRYLSKDYQDAPQLEGTLVLGVSLEWILSPQTFLMPTLAGKQYNWWQALVQNGGRPGTLDIIRKSNSSNIYEDPCERPLQDNGHNFNAYHTETSDLKTFYREETAREAFQGTPKEFLNVFGQLVWTPPFKVNNSSGYRISYALDDLGFWVRVERELCHFTTKDRLPALYCKSAPIAGPAVISVDPPTNLLASLVGKLK